MITFYTRATEIADRGPNPDLWMVPGGPRQLLKRLYFTQNLYPKILRFWPCFLKSNSSPSVWVIASTWQLLMKLVFSYIAVHIAHLSWACYLYLVQ